MQKGAILNNDEFPVALPENAVYLNLRLTNQKIKELLDQGFSIKDIDIYASNILGFNSFNKIHSIS